MEVHPEPLISRYANAGSGSDCGHEPRGTPKAGKFARGNTCASKHRHKRSIKEFTKSDMKELKSEIGGYLGKQQKKAATLNEIKNDLGFSPAKEGDPVNYAIRSMRDSGEVEIVSNRPGDPIIKYKIIAAPGEAKNYAQQILGNLNGKPRPSRLDPGIRGTPEESRPSPFRQGPRLTQEQIDSAQRLPMKMRDARSQKISRPALYNMERFAMAAGESSPKKSWSDPKAKLKIQKLKAFFDANGHKIVKEAMKKFDEQLKRGTNSDEIPDRTEKVDSIVDLFT